METTVSRYFQYCLWWRDVDRDLCKWAIEQKCRWAEIKWNSMKKLRHVIARSTRYTCECRMCVFDGRLNAMKAKFNSKQICNASGDSQWLGEILLLLLYIEIYNITIYSRFLVCASNYSCPSLRGHDLSKKLIHSHARSATDYGPVADWILGSVFLKL